MLAYRAVDIYSCMPPGLALSNTQGLLGWRADPSQGAAQAELRKHRASNRTPVPFAQFMQSRTDV